MMRARSLRVIAVLVGFAALALTLYILQQFSLRPARLLETALLTMTPLAFAAVGEAINEKSGQINVGIEGVFLLSAVAGVYWAEVFNSGVVGLVLGGVTGALLGGALGLMYTFGKADQVIAGLALNILATGLFQYLLMAIWAFPGIHIFSRELVIPRILIPLVDFTIAISPVTLLAFVSAVLAALLLYKTMLGLWIRAVGEKPELLDVAGLSVVRVRLVASIVAGFLVGLGGAFMPLGWFGGLVKEISAGRGFIALAAVVFSGLNPVIALAASFLFGFAEGLAYTVVVTPGVKEAVPFHFIQMTPYLLTVAVLALFPTSRRFPRSLGKPYVRE
jgi:ABC-type uncharacterized transport system permease subunit